MVTERVEKWTNDCHKKRCYGIDREVSLMLCMDERLAAKAAAKAGFAEFDRVRYSVELIDDHPEWGKAVRLKSEWEFRGGAPIENRIKIEDEVRLVSDVRSMSDDQFTCFNDVREKRGLHRLDRMPAGPTVEQMLRQGLAA